MNRSVVVGGVAGVVALVVGAGFVGHSVSKPAVAVVAAPKVVSVTAPTTTPTPAPVVVVVPAPAPVVVVAPTPKPVAVIAAPYCPGQPAIRPGGWANMDSYSKVVVGMWENDVISLLGPQTSDVNRNPVSAQMQWKNVSFGGHINGMLTFAIRDIDIYIENCKVIRKSPPDSSPAPGTAPAPAPAACAGQPAVALGGQPTLDNYNKIQLGMWENEAISLMGTQYTEASRDSDSATLRWGSFSYWDSSASWAYVSTENCRVTSKAQSGVQNPPNGAPKGGRP